MEPSSVVIELGDTKYQVTRNGDTNTLKNLNTGESVEVPVCKNHTEEEHKIMLADGIFC